MTLRNEDCEILKKIAERENVTVYDLKTEFGKNYTSVLRTTKRLIDTGYIEKESAQEKNGRTIIPLRLTLLGACGYFVKLLEKQEVSYGMPETSKNLERDYILIDAGYFDRTGDTLLDLHSVYKNRDRLLNLLEKVRPLDSALEDLYELAKVLSSRSEQSDSLIDFNVFGHLVLQARNLFVEAYVRFAKDQTFLPARVKFWRENRLRPELYKVIAAYVPLDGGDDVAPILVKLADPEVVSILRGEQKSLEKEKNKLDALLQRLEQ